MTATIVLSLCDGEELVVTGSHDGSTRLEGDPREASLRRRDEALAESRPRGERAAGVVPSRPIARDAS